MPTRLRHLLLALLLILSGIPVPAVADAPLADAGLDQTVTKGATVYLDASESRDPDGTTLDYEWTIRAPDGTTVSPACSTCKITTFVARQVGRYDVTITVTDDAGEIESDTLYVTVQPGDPPTATMTGPPRLRTGQTGSYVVEATAGDAELLYVDWYVDGEHQQRDAISGQTAAATLDWHFTSPGQHSVTARVTDRDAQTVGVTVQTDVTDPPDRTPAGDTQAQGQANPTETSSRGTATVLGPRIITGERPLTATYELQGTHVNTITWWLDGTRIGTGPRVTNTFTPGDHSLHALVTYTDGSTGIGRFSDGTTSIEADPRPQIELGRVDGTGGLAVDAVATDAYGNLRTLELLVDGTRVSVQKIPVLRLLHDHVGGELRINRPTTQMEPGTYTVELIATDARGQATSIEQEVTVVGPPVIIRSEFITDGELDSYHPRIDPSRYTATHVLEIKLNGADPRAVELDRIVSPIVRKVENNICNASRAVDNDVLTVVTCWAMKGVREDAVPIRVHWIGTNLYDYSIDTIKTTRSDPEIRVRMISGGAGRRVAKWGIIVDASRSFDPDGTGIIFRWLGTVTPINPNSSIAKFDSLGWGGLLIEDFNGGMARMDQSFIRHFNPRVETIATKTTGPYLPNETVKFTIWTRIYELPKDSYRFGVDLGLDLNGPGEVIDHIYNFAGYAGDQRVEGRHHDQQGWVVEIPARAFLEGEPGFWAYNVYNRKETQDYFTFPEPKVLIPGEPQVNQLDIVTEYVVKEPLYAYKQTVYKSRVRGWEQRGFEVVRTAETGKQWIFQKRQLVSPAVYQTRVREFDSRGTRSVFLSLNPDWQSEGSRIEPRRVTTRRWDWRNGRIGDGTFTGRTRRIQTRPAEYSIEYQYRYEYTTTDTRTHWETRTFRYSDFETYTRQVRRCNQYLGCYWATVTRTKRVTRTMTRRVQETYQVQVQRTGTYWATGKRHYSHELTGRVSRELVHSAKYEYQYQYVVQDTTTVEQRVYLAARTWVVEPAVYDWVAYRITRSRVIANLAKSRTGIRLDKVVPVTEWTLRKKTGTAFQIYDTYTNRSRVMMTRVKISGELSVPYVDPESGMTTEIVWRTVDDAFSVGRFIDEKQAIEIYLDKTEFGNV